MGDKRVSLRDYEMSNYGQMYTVRTPPVGAHVMPHMHWHPHFEIMLIRRGDYTLINNQTTVHRSGSAVFIHCPYSLHNLNTVSDAPYERDLVYVDRALIHRFIPDFLDDSFFTGTSLLCAYPTEEEFADMRQLVQSSVEWRLDKTTGSLYIALLLRRILSAIEQGCGNTVSTEYSYIQDVLRYIGEHLAEKHTLASVAKQYNVSVSKLQRDFSASFGTSFHAHLNTMRQLRANEMVLAGAAAIDIAIECGYCSESHFIKAYREYWGETPRETTEKR